MLYAAHIETNSTTDGAHDDNNSLLFIPEGYMVGTACMAARGSHKMYRIAEIAALVLQTLTV